MTRFGNLIRGTNVFIVWWQFSEILQQTVAQSAWKEYCQDEYFNVSCSSRSDVIMMDSARYGRMQAGRCVTKNIGCSVDVLDYFDLHCSARRHCAVYVSDPDLHKKAPCTKDFTSYLEAKYTCLKVATGSISACQKDRHVTLSGKPVGYIASLTSAEHGYGTGGCPWKIEAGVGQTIRLTLSSFGTRGLTAAGDGPVDDVAEGGPAARDACYEVGELHEAAPSATSSTSRPTVFSMCSDSSRESVFYVSTGNDVTIQLKPPEVLKGLAPFVIKYEVLGCEPFKHPSGGIVKVDGNTAIVRCNGSASKETWYLTCTGNSWLGHIGNCSQKGASAITSDGVVSLVEDNFPYGILIVVAIGVALGVLIGGILLSCVAYYMKRQTRFHGYAEPSEWTKQMLEEMDAYSEAKQLADSRRYIHDGQSSPGASLTDAPCRSMTLIESSCVDINRTVAPVLHVRGCTCPKPQQLQVGDDYPHHSNNGKDSHPVLSAGGASGSDSRQTRFLYEIPQFKSN